MGKALILSLAILAGCQSIPGPGENPRAIWCATNEPRRDARPDTPRSEIDEINRHNALGVKWCNWRPSQ